MEIKDQIASFKKMINGYKLTYIIIVAKKIGIFNNLNERSISLKELSYKLDIHESRLEPILNILVLNKIISKDDSGYYLDVYKDILLENSNYNQLGYIDLASSLIDKYQNIDQSLKNKNIAINNFRKLTEKEAKSFMNGMEANAKPQARYIVENYNFNNHKILDIGAGSGTYLIEVAKTYDSVIGKMIDLPEIVKLQNQNIEKNNLKNRIVAQVCDYNDVLPKDIYDDIFLFAIIHQEPQENLEKLLKNVYNILKPNGRIFLTSFFLNDDKLSPDFSVQFSVEMLLNSNNGKVYTHNEINELLKAAGFNNIERIDNIPGPATLYVVTK